jgi:hypothetical protein
MGGITFLGRFDTYRGDNRLRVFIQRDKNNIAFSSTYTYEVKKLNRKSIKKGKGSEFFFDFFLLCSVCEANKKENAPNLTNCVYICNAHTHTLYTCVHVDDVCVFVFFPAHAPSPGRFGVSVHIAWQALPRPPATSATEGV